MKNTFRILLAAFLVTGCVDSLDDYNIDQKRASEAPPRMLFTSALKNLTDILTTPNVSNNNFRLYTQQWTTTTYLNEPRYSMVSRAYSQNFWQAVYRDVLSDLQEAKRLVEEDEVLDPQIKANQKAVIEMVEVYSWLVLVNTFGNVPYTEALDSDNVLPKYDDAATIFNDLISRLNNAINSITPEMPSLGAGDLFYYQGGNSTAFVTVQNQKWLKFGNSLKLKVAMTLADLDPAGSKAMAEEAAPNVLKSNADNARFPYVSAAPNNNPISANLNPQFSSREDFVASETIVDPMNALNDPRRRFYFTTVEDQFIGGVYGFPNDYPDFSHPSDKIIAANFEGLVMDYSEVEFLLAEAVARGYNVEGTAEEHYNKAIKASIMYWGGTEGEADAYIAQSDVAYQTAAGDYKQKIGFQKWLALYNRGWESWVEWKRLDAPTLTPPSGEGIPPLSIPVRMIYPISEHNENGAQVDKASDAIGGDQVTTKLFWDKF